jgi:thiol-disulfide isomerase/thioredoxin
VVASTLDGAQVAEIGAQARPNDENYLSLQSAQLFAQGMSFSGNERDKFWLNRGADGFSDLSDMSGADSPNDGRAVIASDFDDDGDVDLFVHHLQRERHALLRNDIHAPGAQGASFLKLRLKATRGQHEAIGATVVVRGPAGALAQVLSRGAGFVSCQPPELVFGLGGSNHAEVEVHWPGGARESFGVLAAGTRALLIEGAGEPQALEARPRPLPDPTPPGVLLAVGATVPELELLDASGQVCQVDPKTLANGKRLYVNFWASWCRPCVAELPTLGALASGGDAGVVAIGMDEECHRESARELIAAKAPGVEVYWPRPSSAGPAQGFESLIDLDRLPLPTTLVISPEGKLEQILQGPLPPRR